MARKKSSPTSCCVTGKVWASASTSETTTLLRWTARRRSGSLWFQVTRPLGTTCAGSSRACAQVCCAVIGLPSVLRTAGLSAFGTAGRRSLEYLRPAGCGASLLGNGPARRSCHLPHRLGQHQGEDLRRRHAGGAQFGIERLHKGRRAGEGEVAVDFEQVGTHGAGQLH